MRKNVKILSIIFTIITIINAIVAVAVDLTGVYPINILRFFTIPLFLIVAWLPVIFEKLFKIKLNFALLIVFEIHMALSLIGGSLWGIYEYTSIYDKILHLIGGVMFALFAYNLFTAPKNNRVGIVWLFVVVFSVSIAIGSLWEVCEFSLDVFIETNHQRWQGFVGHEVLFDTMLDIVQDVLGVAIGAIIACQLERQKVKVNREKIANIDSKIEREQVEVIEEQEL